MTVAVGSTAARVDLTGVAAGGTGGREEGVTGAPPSVSVYGRFSIDIWWAIAEAMCMHGRPIGLTGDC